MSHSRKHEKSDIRVWPALAGARAQPPQKTEKTVLRASVMPQQPLSISRIRLIKNLYHQHKPNFESASRCLAHVAGLADVSVSSVRRVVFPDRDNRLHAPAGVQKPQRNAGTFSKFEEEVTLMLKAEKPTRFLREYQTQLRDLVGSEKTLKQIHDFFVEKGISRKKVNRRHVYTERDWADLDHHISVMHDTDLSMLAYLDEASFVDSDFLRDFARGDKGERVTQEENFGNQEKGSVSYTMIMLSQIGSKHPIMFTLYQNGNKAGEGTGGERFVDFWTSPTTYPGITPMDAFPAGWTVVLDNVNFHNDITNEYGQAVGDFLHSIGVTYHRQPRYMPWLNANDMGLFNTIKSRLRKDGSRMEKSMMAEEMFERIYEAATSVSHETVYNCFDACGAVELCRDS